MKLYINRSETVPKCLLEVNQHIHGQLFHLSRYTFKAANEPKDNLKAKIEYLTNALESILEIYNGYKYLLNSKAMSIKGWGSLSDKLYEIREDIEKWQNTLSVKLMKSE